jgi:hypothetical protein
MTKATDPTRRDARIAAQARTRAAALRKPSPALSEENKPRIEELPQKPEGVNRAVRVVVTKES